MKKTIEVMENGVKKERVVSYVPLRYILNILLIFFEIAAVIAVLSLITIYVPYFYFAVVATQVGVAISIIARNDNPDYKLPWLFFVLLIPIIGFMLYFMFYDRKLNRKQRKNVERAKSERTGKDDSAEFLALKEQDELIYSQAVSLTKLSSSHLYLGTAIQYFHLGDELFPTMIEDLKRAEKFIFMEYFIIEDGLFWDSILFVLKEKAKAGVEVRVVYDDIGCMMTLPGNYYKQLARVGIKCVPFSKLGGQANNKFNNRSHRKITVIDGKVGYTGGVAECSNKLYGGGLWARS